MVMVLSAAWAAKAVVAAKPRPASRARLRREMGFESIDMASLLYGPHPSGMPAVGGFGWMSWRAGRRPASDQRRIETPGEPYREAADVEQRVMVISVRLRPEPRRTFVAL